MRKLLALAIAVALTAPCWADSPLQVPLSQGASVTANPTNPSGSTSASLLMMGLGAAAAPCTITPKTTGRVFFIIVTDLSMAGVSAAVSVEGFRGTGTAPANGAGTTGTFFDVPRAYTISAAAAFSGATMSGIATGLVLGTAVWFDMAMQSDGTHSATASNVQCTAFEY